MASIQDIFDESNAVSLQSKTKANNIEGLSILDIVEMFDGDKEAIKSLRELQSNWKSLIETIKKREALIEETYAKNRALTTTERKVRMETAKALYVDFFVDQIQEKLDRVENVLNLTKNNKKKDAYINNQRNIERAKSVPVDTLIKFDRSGFATCIFPDHNEKTGSMKYYKKGNNVYCFGCHQHGDVISVYMMLRNCSFQEAVQALANV